MMVTVRNANYIENEVQKVGYVIESHESEKGAVICKDFNDLVAALASNFNVGYKIVHKKNSQR
jgi:hypothetical protein